MKNHNFFRFEYEIWQDVCDMFFRLDNRHLKSYLQLYPFSVLSDTDKNIISGEDFFEKYIKTGSFLYFDDNILCTNNYLQKSDGSLRNAMLVSPILYLVMQTMGKDIFDKCDLQRNENVYVFYSGNYEILNPLYKDEYNNFFNEVYRDIDQYQFFIKTDLSDFYNNIDIDLLIGFIDEKSNNKELRITQTELLIYKELLLYCGNGRFPLIENSLCSSFLATLVYLCDIDNRLNDYIRNNIIEISSFKMVRYVDDLYILLNVNPKGFDRSRVYNKIIAQYTSILNEYNLKINIGKCKINTTDKISEELKTLVNYSYYYDYDNNLIVDVHADCFTQLLEQLLELDSKGELNVNNYSSAIEECFSIDEVSLLPSDIYNMFVYNFSEELFKSEENVNRMIELLDNKTLVSIDPRRIARLVLASKNGRLIRQMLNNLFQKAKTKVWNFHDTAVAIEYLIQSGFRHIDLKISLFDNNLEQLKRYYSSFCGSNLGRVFNDTLANRKTEITSIDNKTTFLYFMYLVEKRKNNMMLAYSYYYNYFCSLTADIDYLINKSGKHPNYNSFYTEGALRKFYDEYDVIHEAAKLRNTNPVDHASGELLYNNNRRAKLEETINKLQLIQDNYIVRLK